MKKIIYSLLILFILLFHNCMPASQVRYSETRLSISGESTIPVTIILYADEKPDWDTIFAFLESKARLYDYRIEQSPVWKLNEDKQARVPEEIYTTFIRAVDIAIKSKGAFDPTILSLTRLWNFDHQPVLKQDTTPGQTTGEFNRIPPPQAISKALEYVDYTKLMLLEDNVISLPLGFGVDLGGIAKGALVDRLSDYFDTLGYDNYLIEAGGDIVVSGLKPENNKWVIGVIHPRNTTKRLEDLVIGRLNGRNAIVTSGDYEKFFIQDNKRYHHIIDPYTGYPSTNSISVTVIAPSCAQADALATAAFVLGKDQGIRLLNQEKEIEGLIVYEDDEGLKTAMTEGFYQFLK